MLDLFYLVLKKDGAFETDRVAMLLTLHEKVSLRAEAGI